MNSVSKRAEIILFISISLILTGCGQSSKTAVKTALQGATLKLPTMANPLPVVTSGPGVDKFGQKYVNDAYKFAVAFVYEAGRQPMLWQPNLKKNPKYPAVLRSQFSSIADYFAQDLKQIYLPIIPKLISPLMDSKGTLNSDAQIWTKLIMIPPRLADGTLPFPKKYDTANSVLMSPWDLGIGFAAPITKIDNLQGVGPTLKLRFKFTVNYPFGDGKKIEVVATSTKDMSIWIVPNPSKNGSPWLIAKWGYDLGGSDSAKLFDPAKYRDLPTPPVVEFP